jgi:uncharacterized protein (TIGR03437 family)
VIPVVSNLGPGLNGAYPGAQVTVLGSNLNVAGATTTATLNGQPVTILAAATGQINFVIPATATPGIATLIVNNGAAAAFPVTLGIDTAPASILSVVNSTDIAVDSSHPAHRSDLLTATFTGAAAPGSLQVLTGGVLQPALQVVAGVTPGTWQATFLVAPNAALGNGQPLILYLDGRSSLPVTIPIALANGSFSDPPNTGDGN